MTTSNGVAHQAPLYVRALRLRHLYVGGFVSFLLFECMIAVGVLLALAELVSWWAVPVLPAVVAIMVKVNDMVIGGSRRARVQARVQVRPAERGSSDRASSTRVHSDARTGEAPSVSRRTATALDRAEIARAGRAASGGTAGSDATGSGTATGVRARTVEPPAQRKKVGVIKISVPARDGGPGAGVRHAADGGHGISPASDEPPAVPAPAAEEPAGTVAPGDEWTDTDAYGFQRSRPLHPSGWSERPAQDPWAGRAAEPARPAAPDVQADWPGETGGWGDRAAWSTASAGATAPANWGDETVWGDRAAWGDESAARRAFQQAPQQAPQQVHADWDDEAGWADQAAWGSARSQPSWDPYNGWEGGAPDYAADHTGEHTGARPAFGQVGHEQAARDLAARGEAQRAAAYGYPDHTDGYSRYGDTTDGYGRSGDAAGGYGHFGGAATEHRGYEGTAGDERRRFDDGHARDGEWRPQSRESAGRHARHQPPGRRRSEDTDNVTSGHFATGRHADRQWRSDDDLARQRTGGLNQGRFA
ncbi:hypothetical protein ABT297_29870 [Dactylosporangium sp. NPDC000555]|uniref:hypothetical protein n=1 Tax=Dactylosporangium sp. NPDC000555 TaxID=3154260 RepID=UPI003316BB12